ncbi:hypothetical protein C8F04DRAFT_1176795 [Mycena alexandri]|uniref:Uncharacterized protein n=1 Tax=Mycena alexandri TaxID=1745969 RepID=A0AAD6T9N7_9AGAR|nr:hypothetical protein C8F04DRAFT_1176795 [Mycena alexandri]
MPSNHRLDLGIRFGGSNGFSEIPPRPNAEPNRGFSLVQFEFEPKGRTELSQDAQCRNKLSKFWQKAESGYFEKWPEEDELGIVIPPPDDGSAEPQPQMSDEDAALLGKATDARKKQITSPNLLGSFFDSVLPPTTMYLLPMT